MCLAFRFKAKSEVIYIFFKQATELTHFFNVKNFMDLGVYG